MKVYDIICEKKELDEAPAGMISQGFRKLGAKAAAKLGMKGTAGKMATKVDVNAEANRVRQELDQWMAGSNMKQLEVNELITFLDNAGFEKNKVVPTIRKYVKKTPQKQAPEKPDTLTASIDNTVTEAISMGIVDKVILDLVQQGFKKQAGGKQARSKYATSQVKQQTKVDPQDQKAIDLLKKKGYKITK